MSGAAAVQLPVAPRPESDERLSSWLQRLADIYAMPAENFLEYCGLGGRSVAQFERRLGAGEGVLLARRTGMAVEALRSLTFEEIAPDACLMIASSSRYVCPQCSAGLTLHRKAAALPWTFWCPVHRTRFRSAGGRALDTVLPEKLLVALDPCARIGAVRMAAWAEGRDEQIPTLSDLLNFLTTRHRRPSPPSLDEQPRLSLEARRANHEFLTRPIVRQALLVVVPEYDRAAPLLAKPMRPGLFALAQGSLLQNYALAVGVGRLTADPVGHAVTVLLASDPEGEGRIRQALQVWPSALRRRVYVQLRRFRAAQASLPSAHHPSAREIGTLSVSKLRFSQSQNHARGIS